MKIISKIECKDALENLNDIISESDYLLIDRGDLSKEIPIEKIPFTQKIILQRANVIILDEPTNHLDMESIESLNHALSIFEGTIIFVSHDREFISSLTTRLIEIKSDKIIVNFNV